MILGLLLCCTLFLFFLMTHGLFDIVLLPKKLFPFEQNRLIEII